MTKYTRSEIFQRIVDLNTTSLERFNNYITPNELITIEVASHYLEIFSEHYTPGMFQHYIEYTLGVIGRQLTDPLDKKIFVPTEEDYKAGLAHASGPQRLTIWATYLLPISMFSTIYYTLFPYFLDPMSDAHLEFNYRTYNSFRENQTYVSLQARYGSIRHQLGNEMLGIEDDNINNIDENNPESRIEFYEFEGRDESQDRNDDADEDFTETL